MGCNCSRETGSRGFPNIYSLGSPPPSTLAFALEQQQGDRHIYHAHVRAHKGILLNEVVDTAAKAARSQMPIAPDRGKLSELVHRLPNLHQLWWVFCSHAYQQQLPKFDRTANELRWSPTANQATQVTGISKAFNLDMRSTRHSL